MISSFLMGGLGNQMFQIAAAYSLAIENNDKAIFNFDACQTFLQGNPSYKYKKSILKNVETSNEIKYENIYEEKNFHYEKIEYIPNLLLKGYFQSEKYFIKNKEKIKELFYLDHEQSQKLIEKYNIKNILSVGIHIRRGDYLKFPHIHEVCSIEYYTESIKKFNDCQFIVISDDIEWAKQNFKNTNFIFSNEKTEIDDFILMSSCHHNIIANSSFGWWAAYLNKNKNKTIIAPHKWFGIQGPKNTQDLIPKEWIII